MTRRAASARYGAGVALACVIVVLTRIGWTRSPVPYSYDDGAYLASVDAVAAGGAPFRDVFSSQGPLWLPILRAVDLLAGGASWAPRLAPLAAALCITTCSAEIARRGAGVVAGWTAAALVATSGSLFLTSSSLESDGVAAAFGAAAALAAIAAPTGWAALLVGALAACALAVKSVAVVPPLVLAVILLVRRSGTAALGPAAIGAVAVGLAVSAPWGLMNVWDQYIRFHLDARTGLTPGTNLTTVARRFWHADRLLAVSAVLAVVAASVRRHDDDRSRDLRIAVWASLGVAVVVLATTSPLQLQHSTMLVMPLALLVAVHRPPVAALAVAAAVVLPGQAARSDWRLAPPSPRPAEREVVAMLRAIEPSSAMVLADDPGLAWEAGRLVPGWLVDPSFVRIASGHLTVDDVAAAAGAPDVCAVLFSSGRFAQLPGLAGRLAGDEGYELVLSSEHRRLFLRAGCRIS